MLLTKQLDKIILDFNKKLGNNQTKYKLMASTYDSGEIFLQKFLEHWFNLTSEAINYNIDNKYKPIQKAVGDITSRIADWKCITTKGIKSHEPAYMKLMQDAGKRSLEIARIEAGFDVTNKNAVDWANKRVGNMVTEVTAGTKQMINGFISKGIAEGKSLSGVMQSLKPYIGLHTNQVKAIGKYEQQLIADKIPRKTIDKEITAYTKRAKKYRLERIARTENSMAMSQGTLMSLEQIEAETVLFLASLDACSICLGKEEKNPYKIEESYGVIPVHPNCRCTWGVDKFKNNKPDVSKSPHPDRIKEPFSLNLAVQSVINKSVDDVLKKTKSKEFFGKNPDIKLTPTTSQENQYLYNFTNDVVNNRKKVMLKLDVKNNIIEDLEIFQKRWTRSSRNKTSILNQSMINKIRGKKLDYNFTKDMRGIFTKEELEKFVTPERLEAFKIFKSYNNEILKNIYDSKDLTLYRGVRGEYSIKLAKAVKKAQDTNLKTVFLEEMPMNSYSRSKSATREFSQGGIMWESKINIDNTFDSIFTNKILMIANKHEFEVCVLNDLKGGITVNRKNIISSSKLKSTIGLEKKEKSEYDVEPNIEIINGVVYLRDLMEDDLNINWLHKTKNNPTKKQPSK